MAGAQAAGPVAHSLHDGIGLFGDQRVAGVRDQLDRDAPGAEVLDDALPCFRWPPWVERGLQVEHGCRSGASSPAIRRTTSSAWRPAGRRWPSRPRRAATRPPSRKHRNPSDLFPPAQQATSEECAVLSTTLVAVAKNVSPALSFGAWRTL
ncbi:MAG: hypothetical protein B7Z80_26365, partial [Rhodospirillales bacterium 20-64-7]